MKAVILAGGLGTRLSEETIIKPKPMVEIGNRPILWHIMKMYAAHGVNDFVICCGYKSHVIKDYFANYYMRTSDVTFDMRLNQVEIHTHQAEPWKVTLVETGDSTMTGGRLKRVRDFLDAEAFCFTYGDGVSDVDISQLIQFHRSESALATLTAVQPPGRFGAIVLHHNQARVSCFHEKPSGDGAWINGGYFVLEPQAIDFVRDDTTIWEQEPLQELARTGHLAAYKHSGFWQPMDTLRDKQTLEELWTSGAAPWKVW